MELSLQYRKTSGVEHGTVVKQDRRGGIMEDCPAVKQKERGGTMDYCTVGSVEHCMAVARQKGWNCGTM